MPKNPTKPKPYLVYDSVECGDYMHAKYGLDRDFLGDYIRSVYTEYANGTEHVISDEDLGSSKITDEERHYIELFLDEFGTKDPECREVVVHYWW